MKHLDFSGKKGTAQRFKARLNREIEKLRAEKKLEEKKLEEKRAMGKRYGDSVANLG